MKKIFQLGALALLPASANLYANHPAASTVDEEEAYTLVDSFVADTPHGRSDFNEMGADTTKTSVTIGSLSMFESMVARGDLREYIEMFDGEVNASITFNDNGSVTMTVDQAG